MAAVSWIKRKLVSKIKKNIRFNSKLKNLRNLLIGLQKQKLKPRKKLILSMRPKRIKFKKLLM